VSASHGPGSPECRALFERLSEYLDGELDGSACAHIEEHLGDCAPCVAFLESLRRTVRWIERTDAPALPPELRQRLAEALRAARGDAGT
jgi:mycothiol system anti-sigma-R factor